MTRPRFAAAFRPRLALAFVLAVTAFGLLAAPGGAAAAISGQQEVWGAFGTQPEQLYDPGFMAVDPADGSVFIASYPSDFSATVIKKFNEKGEFQGSVEFPGLAYVGIAVDPTNERLYVLEDESTAGGMEASKILAFETKPQDGHLVPASPAELPVPAVGSAAALRTPRELVFDPHTEDLIVLAEDEGHEAVLQRIGTSGAGSIGAAWVDTGHTVLSEGAAIAIDQAGLTYVMSGTFGNQFDQEVDLETLPVGFTAASAPKPLPGATPVATAFRGAADFYAAAPSPEGYGWGPQLAVSTAPNGEDTLYWKLVNRFGNDGAGAGKITVVGYSVGGEVQTVAFGGGSTEGVCSIQTQTTALAIGHDGSLVTLDQGQEVASVTAVPEWFPIISRFGPGGSGCPAPNAAIKLTDEGGTQIADGGNVAEGARVILDGSETELNGNVLEGVGWKIEGPDGTTAEDREKAAHVFTVPGTYTVRLGIEIRNGEFGSHFGTTKTVVVTAGSGVTEFPLSVGTTGAGSAAVECDTGGGFGSCASEYPKGEEIAFRATPHGASEVVGWTGCVESGGDECTVEDLDAATSVSVAVRGRFALHLSTSGTGNGSFLCAAGTGTAAACAAEYEEGEMVTISPVAGAGSEFAGWGGACTGTGTCRVDIEGEESVSAMFNKVPPVNTTTTTTTTTSTGTSTTSGNSTSAGSTGSTVAIPPPPPGKQKTAAQIAEEKRTEALVKCKKMHGKAKTECVKKANLIGKPKPKHKATKNKKKH